MTEDFFPYPIGADDGSELPTSRRTDTDAYKAANVALALLSVGGWTGSQIEFLQRVAALEDTAEESVNRVLVMREMYDREEALRR
jgi:hypothetical protein